MSWRLFDITAKRAELAPGAIAFEDARSGETLSYGALETRAAQAAAWLVKRGVKPGDRVGVLCRNRTELFELLFACGKTGAILVPLNWRMTAAELVTCCMAHGLLVINPKAPPGTKREIARRMFDFFEEERAKAKARMRAERLARR